MFAAADGIISFFLWLSSIPLYVYVCVYTYIYLSLTSSIMYMYMYIHMYIFFCVRVFVYKYIYVCVYHIFFIQPPVDGHKGCLHVVNSAAAVNIRVHDRFALVFSR